MKEYIFNVSVVCETAEEASTVMAERLGYEEDYGFEYEAIDWWLTEIKDRYNSNRTF